MLDRVERRCSVTIATTLVVAVVADQLARRAPVVAGYAWIFPAGGGRPYDRAMWEPDPQLLTVRDGMWLLAVGVAVWLAVRCLTRTTNSDARRRWMSLGMWTGLAVGLVVGVFAFWLERPRTLMAGEVGLVAISNEVQAVLGPLGDIVAPVVSYAGHDVWLVAAPTITWALYGGGLGAMAAIVGSLVPERPNER